MHQLAWLPKTPDWRGRLQRMMQSTGDIWPDAAALARERIDFTQTIALDAALRARHGVEPPSGLATRPVRLAILGSSTLSHLHAGLRVAGLRRGIRIATYENAYGQYLQELLDPGSALHVFRPDTILFALDADHLARATHAVLPAKQADAALTEALESITRCWTLARDAFGCAIIQQTALDVFPANIGSNEHRLPGSPSRFIARLNHALRDLADTHGADLLALDDAARVHGLNAWYDPALWHRAKQEVSPVAGPTYGELAVRVIAARQGLSYKCLVLDLDNTLWGGVLGDDGIDGIVLGQGSELGEGFSAVQRFARDLGRRGIILAVCSKNDEATARAVFDTHPDMVLRGPDIACFHANWNDKAANIRAIAETLNIGLDSMVFLDDSAFERNLVRAVLPMVAVPELPDGEPSLVPRLLAEAGYFESVALTETDFSRAALYEQAGMHQQLRAGATDMGSYLRSLEMKLLWSHVDPPGLSRVVQLINKTNQFNLTTRRHTEADLRAIMADTNAFALQLRLLDRFGDNGVIAVVIGRMRPGAALVIDTWLMSCRVLGREVEAATLAVVAEVARTMGARTLVGEYRPTQKNLIVRDHYERLGFSPAACAPDGSTEAVLTLEHFIPEPSVIEVQPTRRHENAGGLA